MIQYYYRNIKYQLPKLKKSLEENIEVPAGRLESKFRDYTVKLESGFKTEDDFRNLVIKKEKTFPLSN